MHIPWILKSSSEHQIYEFTKSNYGVHLKQDVFVKGSRHDLISQACWKRVPILTFILFFLKRLVPQKPSIVLQIILPARNQSGHCIPPQVSKKKKRCMCMLILEIWHDFIVRTTFLLHLFNHGDVHESFILFKSEKLNVNNHSTLGTRLQGKITGTLENIHDTNHE